MAIKIHLSQAFLDRFPEEKREEACNGAERILQALHRNGATSRDYRDRISADIKAGYFDADAVIEIFIKARPDPRPDLESYRLPAITALFALQDSESIHWIRRQLADVIAEHPRVNDEAGNGAFSSAYGCAVRHSDWKGIELLSYNPNINPNELFPEPSTFCRATTSAQVDKNIWWAQGFDEDEDRNTLERMMETVCNFSQNGRVLMPGLKLLQDIDYTTVMCLMIDRGAILTPMAREYLKNPILHEVESHVLYSESAVKHADPANCSLSMFKHAYALNMLGPWFERAREDDAVRDHLMELRQEMPKWMKESLATPYEILGATDWVELSETPTRGQGFAGRFA